MSVSSDVCFIDTNIWLYAFLEGSDAEKHLVVESLIQSEQHIVISSQVINEVSSNLLKKGGFTETEIRQIIDSLYKRYQIITLDHSMMLHASYLRERYQFSFWDGLIISCALAAGATTLYSEDMHNGLVVENQLTIVNPFLIGTSHT